MGFRNGNRDGYIRLPLTAVAGTLAGSIAARFKAGAAQANTQICGSNEKTQGIVHMRHMRTLHSYCESE